MEPEVAEFETPRREPLRSRVWREAKAAAREFARVMIVGGLVTVFVAQPVRVDGTSMLPRLHDGERIIINKFAYELAGWPSKDYSIGSTVERGDIVVFYYPEDPSVRFVKRVIGLPGDQVRIDARGGVWVNGERIEEPYLSPEYTRLADPMPTTTVRDHHYFVMGDNRDNSSDSRSWGLVPEKYICGRAMFRFWPPSEIGTLGD